MSSWLGALASKTETLLNKVDQAAGQALQKDANEKDDVVTSQWLPSQKILESSTTYSPYFTSKPEIKPLSSRPSDISTRILRNSSLGEVSNSNINNKTQKDSDQELFDFLNNPSNPDLSPTKDLNSRPSSSASNLSSHSGKIMADRSDGATTATESSAKSQDARITDEIPHHEISSGYQESGFEGGHHLHDNSSSIQMENQLLKNEIVSLNREMQTIIRRIQSTQDELNQAHKKLDVQSRQLSKSEQIVRELQSHESDLQETLATKDTQLGVLRTRLEEADQELVAKKRRITEIQAERDSIFQDHSLSTGVQSHALDTLQERLQDAEQAVHREQESHARTQEEFKARVAKLEADKQDFIGEVGNLQKSLAREKAVSADIANQLKTARVHAESCKQELSAYKDKATRILQSKDRLIASLKEGTVGLDGSGASEPMVLSTELESMRQERDILREDLHSSQMALENMRAELSELESQMQQESDSSREHITSLEEQFDSEKRRREDIEIETNRQKQELRYVHEELLKQKTAFQTRLQDRDAEINRLRNQLMTKSLNATSQEELENRLHSLTESLIQKQTMLEALSTEKCSLVLQLERMERRYQEAEASALRTSTAAVNMTNDDDEVRQRLPGFMRESPFDGKVTRRVKNAANSIDRFSMRLGVFLRRYPIARVFVICYMGLLHLWVMIVLLTYKPEMHDSDLANPHAPM